MAPEIALLSEGEFLYPSLYFSVIDIPALFNLGNFRQHITCSTVTGIAVGGIAYHFGFSSSASLVSAGLCSFAGMLPDIDSDTSKSFQECIYLTAGIGCLLTAARLRYHGFDADLAMLGGAFMFLFIRFVVAMWIKKVTTHRGMIHSIPMAILSGELVFFVVTGTAQERLVKAAALTIGFLSHLILDEIYSIDSTGATLRLKRSFGTALKWTNPKRKGSVMLIYTLMVCFGFSALAHPEVIEQLNGNVEVADQSAPPNKTFSTWWSQLSTAVNNVSQKQQNEVQREAAEFLSQQGTTSMVAKPYSAAVAKPANSELSLFLRDAVPMAPLNPLNGETSLESELPSAMQIGNVWYQDVPIQPAAIIMK